MKLQTQIQPRRSGTVTAHGPDGALYTFAPDADGVLTCDVQDDAAVALLLESGNFYPAETEDLERAQILVAQHLAVANQGQGEDDQTDDDGDDDGDEFEEAPNGGMPVEANSPLKPAPSVKAGGRPRKAK